MDNAMIHRFSIIEEMHDVITTPNEQVKKVMDVAIRGRGNRHQYLWNPTEGWNLVNGLMREAIAMEGMMKIKQIKEGGDCGECNW